MKVTLLEIVQGMLAAIDAENVSSVGETPEAGMCVELANICYESMITVRRWRHLKTLAQLNSGTYINQLTLPSGTQAVDPYNIYYDSQRMEWLDQEEFLARTISRDTTASDITEYNNIKVQTGQSPHWVTSFDDETLVFDAIPDIINGLVASKSRVMIFRAPTTRLSDDDDYFDLPAVAFPAFQHYCIAQAVLLLKGDSQTGGLMLRQFRVMMQSLAATGKVIDNRTDFRKWIVPRRSFRNIISPLRYTGSGYV